VSKINAPLITLVPGKYTDLIPYLEALEESIREKAASVADGTAADAATAEDAPVGGTGTAAGGYDTAANRDLMITSQNNIIDDVEEIRVKFNTLETQFGALLTSLRDRGVIND
jgi:hypothetical protein